jgi:predicted ferric reductase
VAIGLLALLRRVAYELTLKLHQALALLLLGSLYGHIPKGSRMARMLLYVTAGLFCTGTVLQLCRIMYRNIPPPSTMRVHKHGGAAIVSIELRRGWKIRAGQYVQLCFPGVTALSGFESHPFMICWWDQRSDQHPLVLEVLVAERKARSFTSRFQRLLNDEQGRRGAPTVFVDGPFGVSADLHKYSTVLLVATGIGIAAQLPYTKELVRASSHWTAMTRKVLLVWEVENHGEYGLQSR